MDDVVSRLHRALVAALHERGHSPAERPVTVAEIYQELVPYRAVRDYLGVELNADYEHALLRLLAGEGDRVRLEPVTAREELRAELEAPDPYVGIYRKFAACDAWVVDLGEDDAPVATARMDVDAIGAAATSGTPPAAPPARPRVEDAHAAVAGRGAGVSADTVPGAAGAAPGIGADPGAARSGATGVACAFCKETLPQDRTVRFCPFCGMDQRRRPCAGCGEVLEPAWRFCIACGVPVDPTLRAPAY